MESNLNNRLTTQQSGDVDNIYVNDKTPLDPE